MKGYYVPTPHEESLATKIVQCAHVVHTTLGPGLLEAVYERCFCYELEKRDICHARQVSVPLVYDWIKLPWGMRLDALVDGRVICELKAVEALTPVYVAQVLTQLKLAELHLGFLINFNVRVIKDGIRGIIR